MNQLVRKLYPDSVRNAFQSLVFPILLFAIALMCAAAVQLLTPHLKNVSVDDGRRRIEDVPFPFLRQTSEFAKEYRISADIEHKPYQFTRLTLLPVLCLSSAETNARRIEFPLGHCDFVHGYEMSLPVAHTAGNQSFHLEAKVSTSFEIFGLSARAPTHDSLAITLELIGYLSFASGFYLTLRRVGLSWGISAIFLAALIVQLHYLSHTPVIERTYDVLGHVQHIEFIANNWSLPSSNYCHECYQPSLYYAVAAAIYSIAGLARIFDPMVVLQFFSLALFWVFLLMATRIVLLWFARQRDVLLATALLTFWPGGFLHSPRVSNDIPLYAFFAICLYFVLNWWKTGIYRHLLFAAIVAGCGVLIKATMVILMATIGVLIAFRLLAERQGANRWPIYIAPVLIMVAGLTIYVAQSSFKGEPFLSNSGNSKFLLIAGDRRLWPSMYVGNSWKQYLLLNIRSYFTLPFVYSLSAVPGREYFWNYVLKSSMFGDYDWFARPIQRYFALIMSPVLLGLVVCFWAGIIRMLRGSARKHLPLLVVIALSFLSLFAHRFYSPYSANNDFRFIYPVLIPILLLLVEGIRDSSVGRALCVSFCSLSVAFYLSV